MTAMDDNLRQRQLDLVEQIYEAAMGPPHWRGLCARLAAAFGADSAVLALLDERGPARVLDHSANFTAAMQSQYEQHFCHEDLWARRARELGAGRVYSSAELVADADFMRSSYYADFCRPAGIFYVVGALLPLAPRRHAVLGIHRPRRAGHYDRDAQRQLAALLPHLQRALRLELRLEQAGLALRCDEAALASARVAAIVVDAELTVLHATDSAAALLAPASPLRLLHGRLSATVAPGGASLAQLVRAALPGPGRAPRAQSCCLPRHGLAPLTLTVAPLPAPAGSVPRALLLLRATEQATVDASALRQLYQLTPAEADVAKALAEGGSLEQHALARGISMNTIKTHLQRVYAKTGACRQGELVALLHGSAAIYDVPGLTHSCDDGGDAPPYTVRTGRPHDRLATGPRDARTAFAPTHCDRSTS
ncbi:helix-turn-helix transcriptional regulator [Duganella sp. LX20W]|uniref:Helix-turn-helix transcriptional regulator n=1 Tax=Rugamonas brunnea TaxID=2758569 RepID=A0A7W2EX32_9BURK|nr:helix-turn-helix transcriptional regulator [Rugamonas brunnea]MBA5640233.1 helix-turn-helix transcriptional regulator [Rugamonas brunnea]